MNVDTLLAILRIITPQPPAGSRPAAPGEGWVRWQTFGGWQRVKQGQPCFLGCCSFVASVLLLLSTSGILLLILIYLL